IRQARRPSQQRGSRGDEDLRRQYIASITATGGRGSRGSLVLAQRLGLYGNRKHKRGGDFRPEPSRVRFRDWSRSGLRGLGGRWPQRDGKSTRQNSST